MPKIKPKSSTPRGKRKKFPGISSRAFEHPTDRAALTALRKMTGFDTLLRKVVGALGERRMRLLFLANGVRVNGKQLPHIHLLLEEVCEQFEMEIPELYLTYSPLLNAVAVGVDRPFIVLNSALVESMTDVELRCVIAHELSHILSGHALYKTLCILIFQAMSWIVPGPMTLITLPIALGLKEWERKSELSADRGALLATQDLEITQSIIIKLAGGAKVQKFDMGEFEKQAEEYQNGGTIADNIFKILNLIWMTHPFPVQRIIEIKKWGESKEYKEILDGNYPTREDEPSEKIHRDVSEAVDKYRETFSEAKDSLSELLKDATETGSDLFKKFFGSDYPKNPK